jgi:hypothetical protein
LELLRKVSNLPLWQLWFGFRSYSHTQNSSPIITVFMNSGLLFMESKFDAVASFSSSIIFLTVKNQWKLHITSLKCCLPATDTIDRKNSLKVGSCQACLIKIHQVFEKRNLDSFLTDLMHPPKKCLVKKKKRHYFILNVLCTQPIQWEWYISLL